MNGRVYDPDVGRFLSADPHIQFPESTQGFNRYTYVNNNPMSYNDPSGFFIKGLVAKFVGGWITGVTGQAWLGKLVEGFLSSGGDARAMFIGQISGGISNGIAGGINAVSGVGSSFSGILAQGVSSKLHGGNFADGIKGGAIGMVEGIASGTVVDAGKRAGQRIRMITSSGTSSTVKGASQQAGQQAAVPTATQSNEYVSNHKIDTPAQREALVQNAWDMRNELGMEARSEVTMEYKDIYAKVVGKGFFAGKIVECEGLCTINAANEEGAIRAFYSTTTDHITIYRSAVEGGVSDLLLPGEEAIDINITRVNYNNQEQAIHVVGHEVGHSNGDDRGYSITGTHPQAEQAGVNAVTKYRSLQ